MSNRTAVIWAIVAASMLATFMGLLLARRPVGPPEPCRDSADVTGMEAHCPPGATMEVYPAGGQFVLVKCICPKGKP